MKTKTHTNKLQKSSGLFFQLGLLLTLFTVYIAVEHKTEKLEVSVLPLDEINKINIYNMYDNIIIESKEVIKKKVVLEKNTFSGEYKESKQKDEVESKLLSEFNETTPVSNSDILEKLVEIPREDPLVEDFMSVQEKPIFPGCEKVKESKRKACFEKKIRKYVSRKFNAELAPKLGLSSGKKRIAVEFLITKTGEIEITNSSAPHKALEKEGRRVVNKLPKMIPGKQNGKEVNVKYILPIIFNVE